MTAKVYPVSAGPGDPELLTQKEGGLAGVFGEPSSLASPCDHHVD